MNEICEFEPPPVSTYKIEPPCRVHPQTVQKGGNSGDIFGGMENGIGDHLWDGGQGHLLQNGKQLQMMDIRSVAFANKL